MSRGAFRLSWDKSILLLLILLVLFGGMNNEYFATGDNVNFILGDISEIMLIAFPMALLIIVKEIDLSVASSLTLASALCGVTWQATGSIWVAVLAGIMTGVACGLLNGLLVTRLGLSSLAVTIGTLALYRGLCYVALGDTPIADFPTEFTDLGYTPIAGTFLPWVVVPMVVAGIVFWYVLHGTRFGRWLFAIGQGDEAAEFSGIPVLRVKLWLFILTGLMCGIAGIGYTVRFASSSPDGALGFELLVIAAVLFGGVAIAGGVGTIWGVIAAVLIWGFSQSYLQLIGWDANALVIVSGVLLLLSVTIPRLLGALRESVAQRTFRPKGTEGAPPPPGEGVAEHSPAGAGHDQGSHRG
ncbi:MAG: ABC transporter permease [Actinomycetales bacterium]|nr:ABC transporter permease [Actinomycetales bacterium]